MSPLVGAFRSPVNSSSAYGLACLPVTDPSLAWALRLDPVTDMRKVTNPSNAGPRKMESNLSEPW